MKESTVDKTAGIRIGTKPRISTGLCGVFGLLMMASGNAALMFSGLIFAAAALIVVFVIRDKTCAQIYADRIVLYSDESQADRIVPLNEVTEWNTQGGIWIRTREGQQYFVETRDTLKAHRALKKRVPELETSVGLQRKLRERRSRKRRSF